MDQTTAPAADQTTEQAAAPAPAPVAATPAPADAGPDLVDTATAAAVAADNPSRARAQQLIAELRDIEAEAVRTPNLGAAVARLAGLLAGVLDEAAAELDQLAARG